MVQRQSEALVKRRNKDTPPGAFVTRSQRNQRNMQARRQHLGIDQGSEDNEEDNENNGEKESSSTDERSAEPKKKRKRGPRVRPSQPSSSRASPDGGFIESDVDMIRETRGLSSRHLSKPQKLTWGKGRFRSNTRHGSGGGSSSKSSRVSRVSKFVDYLKNLDENTDEV